jgi:prepilin signal peptidase PulO-like enzyme (type II secretory pathway)
MVPWWRLAVFGAFSIPITFFDLRDLRIPDALSLGGAAALVVLEVFAPARSLPTLLVEGAIAFGVFATITLATRGKLGLGDAKYSLLIVLALGMFGWLTTLAVASVSGLVVGLILVRRHPLSADARIPFAPFLTFGAAVSIVMDRLFPGGLPA